MAKFFLVNFFVKLNFGLSLYGKFFYKVSLVDYFFTPLKFFHCKVDLIID